MFSELLCRIRDALAALSSGDVETANSLLSEILSAQIPDDDPNAAELAAIVETAGAAAEALAAGETAEAVQALEAVAQGEEATGHRSALRLEGPSDRGRLWEVTLVVAGLTANGQVFPVEVLRDAVPMFENVRCYDNHLTDAEYAANPHRDVGDLLGWIDGVHWDEERRAIRGMFHVAAGWLRTLLWNLWEEGSPAMPGLSVDIMVQYHPPRVQEGRVVRDAARITAVNSVDVVQEPAAGGALDRLVAARAEPDPVPEPDPVSARLADLDLRMYRLDLRERLVASELPRPAQDFLLRQLADRVLPLERVDAAISDQRALVNSLAPAARVTAGGTVRGLGPVSEVPDFARDLEALCGWAPKGTRPRFRRLSDWYVALTGDELFRGAVSPERTTEANVTTSTLADICADVLNKRLIAEWEDMERWWEPLVSRYEETTYQNVKVMTTNELSALSTVAEGEPYVEKTWGDTQETAQIVKKGNYIGITLESIMADDVRGISRIPGLLGRAWYLTVSNSVSNVFSANGGTGPTMTDGEQLFSPAHLNTGAEALSHAAYTTATQAVMSQSVPGSLRKLGVPAKFLLVPVDLFNTGLIIRNSQSVPGGPNNDANSWYQMFEVVIVPDWVDTNDWAAMADPRRAPTIGLHTLAGQETPELFTADGPTQGAMFTNDELRVKIRGWLAVSVADYRPVYKSNVL